MKTDTLLGGSLVGVLCLMVAGTGFSAPLVYDGFESYTNGDLNGQSGGTGWTGAWSADPSADVVSASLSYSSGVVSVNGGTKAVQFGGVNSNALWTRPFTAIGNTAAPDGGDEFYFSFLYRHVSGDANDFVSFWLSEDNDREFSAIVGDLSTGGNTFGARVQSGSAGDFTDLAASAYADNVTYFLVARVSKDGSNATNSRFDQVDLWINPTSLTLGAPQASVDRSTGLNGDFDFFGLRTVNLNGVVQFDELRIGNTIEDVVTVIPEPATALMMAVGLLASFFLRRRRA